MLKISMIRHGKTGGNLLGRYIGTTDESLCPQGRRELTEKREAGGYGKCAPEMVYTSPMKRCVETANLLFPGTAQHIVGGFRECSFGEFENKNYLELDGNPRYQAWVDSGGTLPFPGGESREEFARRTLTGFRVALRHAGAFNYRSIALVVHGGTIMSIMDAFATPEESFYHWQVKNGCGFITETKNSRSDVQLVLQDTV